MLAAFPLVFLLSLPAAKDHAPLLVVVEAGPKEVVESQALRDGIAADLGIQVLSPVDEAPAEGVVLMTIAMAPDRAVVSVRFGETTIRRAIDLPVDRRQRLQLVTWLAGNIVRDQTADLLRGRDGDGPSEKPQELPSQAASQDESTDVVRPPPPATPAPLPTPLPTPLASTAPQIPPTQPATATAAALPPARAQRHPWTVAALIGRGFLDPDRVTCNCGEYWVNDQGGQYEIEVMRGGPSFALGGTYIHARGTAVGLTLGWYRQVRPWFAAETAATVGLWSWAKHIGFNATTDLFVRLGAGLAVNLAAWMDVTARLSLVHAMSGEKYLGDASIGLRYRLP